MYTFVDIVEVLVVCGPLFLMVPLLRFPTKVCSLDLQSRG